MLKFFAVDLVAAVFFLALKIVIICGVLLFWLAVIMFIIGRL